MKIKLFIDCQYEFFGGSMKCESADENLAFKLKKSFEKSIQNNDKVIFTLETHHKSTNKKDIEQQVFPEHCLNLSPGWQMIPHLQDMFDRLNEKQLENIVAIEKKTFGSIELIAVVRGLIKTSEYIEIELCGLPTDLSVFHNAIILYNTVPNAKFSIDSTCCAGTTNVKHNIALKMLENIGFKIKQ